MTDVVHVFVYGTFRPPQTNTSSEDSRFYPQIAPYILATAPAQVADATLYDLGSYPGARPGQGILLGDLLMVKAEALAVLDEIERHPTFYRRTKVIAETMTGSQEAWIYLAPEDLVIGSSTILSGDWFNRSFP